MKNLITIILWLVVSACGHAQSVNWKSVDESQQNMAYLNFSYDFGVTTQLGFSHKLKSKMPIMLLIDYSFPMGKDLIDDFKIRAGGQIEIIETNGFLISAKIIANFRRHQTELVRIVGFGTELSLLAGYYKTTWHIAGEFGFDKSIITHLKHSEIMKGNFPNIQNGWYLPAGGYFFGGLQGSKTIGDSIDITIRLGLTNAQGEDENAFLPYYSQLGVIKRF